MNHRRGFSLIELMITVSIASILAAIAYPRFLFAENQARRAEVSVMLGQMQHIQYSWYGDHNCFVGLRQTPEGVPAPTGRRNSWVSLPTPAGTPRCGADWGFVDTDMRQPGTVYFLYECEARAAPLDYTCSAIGDLDEDGRIGEYQFCTDFRQSGAGCVPSASGVVSLFPFEIVRVSPSLW